MRVFDGEIVASNLTIKNPFDNIPELKTNIKINIKIEDGLDYFKNINFRNYINFKQ